eukprot:5838722-Prymnesium_polylepis.1
MRNREKLVPHLEAARLSPECRGTCDRNASRKCALRELQLSRASRRSAAGGPPASGANRRESSSWPAAARARKACSVA